MPLSNVKVTWHINNEIFYDVDEASETNIAKIMKISQKKSLKIPKG
jgi:hypothetical protein